MIGRKTYIDFLIAAVAVIVAALPFVAMRYAIDYHAGQRAHLQLSNITDRMVTHADGVLTEASDLLSMLSSRIGKTCNQDDRAALVNAIQQTSFVRDVLILLDDGTLCRAQEQATAIALPIQFRPVRSSAFSLGVMTSPQDYRSTGALVLRERDRQLFALLVPDALRLDIVPVEWRGDATGSIQLDDGSVIGRVPFTPGQRSRPDTTEETVSALSASETFPVNAALKLPLSTSRESMASLILFVNVGGIGLGVVFVVLVLSLLKRPVDFETTIERGLRRREFVPYYQPCFSVATGALVGCEVLIRWIKPDGTIIPPGMFIQKAEETGLAVPMTIQLMEKMRDEMGPLYGTRPDLKLAINLFADHFNDMSAVESVKDLFANSPIRFSQLVFEVTERYPLPNLNRARTAIAGFQELGCRVALDDAGTGHGGLTYLQKLGMDQIKIDKIFIDSIVDGVAGVPIVDSLIALGHEMNLEIVAEGVETVVQLRYLKARNVDTVQGFLFAPPLSFAKYSRLVEEMIPVQAPEPSTPVRLRKAA